MIQIPKKCWKTSTNLEIETHRIEDTLNIDQWAERGRASRGKSTPIRQTDEQKQNLCQEVSQIVLDVTLKFLKFAQSDVLNRHGVFAMQVFNTFSNLLSKNQSIAFIARLFFGVEWCGV